MNSEQFIKRMKKNAENEDILSAHDTLIDFANELSQQISKVLNGKVCEPTALVVASVLEGYASAIREEHKSPLAKMSENIYDLFAKKECVSMKVPMDLFGGNK